MVDIESPKQFSRGDVDYARQTSENFGEAPIVPDDEGPPVRIISGAQLPQRLNSAWIQPVIPRNDVSTTETHGSIGQLNDPPQGPQNQIAGMGSAETVETLPADSWSESGLTDEYEDSRANPFRLRDVHHAAAAQTIMDEFLRVHHPKLPIGSVIPPATEQLGVASGNPVSPPNPLPGSAVEDEVISDLHHKGGPLSSADAPVQDLANAIGVWSAFSEASTSRSQTNGSEEP
ncbi:hypothetical protein FRC01_007835 [Tulasnella sp. 417]|nr:hypothetical protein FRC01_007835 [Tulasnella sp. 417]